MGYRAAWLHEGVRVGHGISEPCPFHATALLGIRHAIHCCKSIACSGVVESATLSFNQRRSKCLPPSSSMFVLSVRKSVDHG